MIKLFIKIFFYLLAPVILLIIVILRPLYKIKFYLLSTERIGELNWSIESFFYNNKFVNKKNYTIFISTDIISNKTLVLLAKKKIKIVSGKYLFPTYRLLIFFSNYFKWLKNLFYYGHEKEYDLMQRSKRIFLSKDNKKIILNTSYNDKGESFLKSLGIDKKDKIVCLHVRDSEYLKKKFSNNFDYHSYRDCDIKKFISSIIELCEKGYFVFRMGEFFKDDFNINHKNFINYAGKLRSDFLDIFLSSRCEFSIGTGAGYDTIPSWTFRKPYLYTNAVPLGPIILNPCSKMMFSMKIHFDKKKEKFLNIDEIFDKNLQFAYGSSQYDEENITLLENTQEDLKEMTNEFTQNFLNKNELTDLQIEFNKKVLSLLKIGNIGKDSFNKLPIISNYFLKKYSFLL